ncbi:MAG: mechanosensitive ion channel family protein [Betaproteobacteria bacterium]|nr:mechanosensitive ion channel family protein [Betaproteobacteria bacterium]
MRAILDRLGLGEIPYLLDAIEITWRVALVLILAWVLWSACKRLIVLLHERAAARGASVDELKRIETMTQVFRYAAGVVIAIVTGMLLLGELGISIAPLLATAGIAGIAIGFGVQSLVKDYFTGIVLLLENQIRKGDAVEVAGKSGQVEEVTLRYVRLRDYEGVVHFIPNGLITTVSNHSMEFAHAVVSINIAHGNNVDAAIAAMREAGSALRADPEYAAGMLGDLEIAGIEQLSDSGSLLRARCKVLPSEQGAVRRELLKRVKAAFAAHGIDLPAAQIVLVGGRSNERPLRVEVSH